MQTVPLPLFTRVYKNADEAVLTDQAALQYNGYLDALAGLNVRPGEVQAFNSGSQNDGLYMWPDKDYIVSVDGGLVSLKNVSSQTLVDAYALGVVTFIGDTLVTFATNGTYVFMAAGGKIQYVNEFGVVAEIADPDAPATVSHVAFLDGYILAINGDSKMYWAEPNDPTNWAALNFASAEANPDKTKAMHIVQRQIYIMGTISTEIWENDGTTPFARIPGGLIEVGCGAPYSVARHGNSLMWLSHTRQFVQFTGISVKFISSPYDKEIANFSVVSDCVGGYMQHNGQEYCVFHFPTEQRTLVYNPALEDWSEWAVWDSATTSWQAYDFRATARDLDTGQTFIGKKDANVIACLSADSRVDLTGNGTTTAFKFLRQTGWINNGISKKKRIEQLRFRAKRGTGISSGTPVLMLRYRNDGSSQWSNIREISLGDIGETEHEIMIPRLGICKSRQWEISATDDVPIVLSGAEAEITVLR